MKKNYLYLLSFSILAACNPINQDNTTSHSINTTKSFSFDTKASSKVENNNSGIIYSGNWITSNNASASGGSYSSGTNIYDNNDGAFKYVGNWLQGQTGNSAPSLALGGSIAFGYSTPVLTENNAISPNLSYTGSGWNHAGSLGSSGFSYNYIYPYNTTFPYNASNITYNGAWTTVAGSYNTNDGTQGGYADISFYGTNIQFVGYKGPDRGKVNLTLYDKGTNEIIKTINDIDLYNPSEQISAIGTFSALPYKWYYARITPSGSKNSSSTGYRYDLVKALFYPAIEYKFTGSHLRYQTLKYERGGKVNVTIDGDTSKTSLVDLYAASTPQNPWGYVSVVKEVWGLSSGEHRVTVESTPFSSALHGYNVMTLDSFDSYPGVGGTFTGNSASFYILKHPAYGIMNLWIDNQLNQVVDLYSASSSFQTINITGLTAGTHDFSFQGRPDKNPSASNNYFNFDGLKAGDLPKATHTFTGTGVEYIATKSSGQGRAEVFIDNVSQGIFDLYNAGTLYQQSIFSVTGLANANHSIDVRSQNTKNSSSTGYGINIDNFNIITRDEPSFSFGNAVNTNAKYVEIQPNSSVNVNPNTIVNLSALAYDNPGNQITDATSNDKWLWSISPVSPYRGYITYDGSNNQVQFKASGTAGSATITAESKLTGKKNSVTININDVLPAITAFSPTDSNVILPASNDSVANVTVPAGSNAYSVSFYDGNNGDWVSPNNSKIAYERAGLSGTNSGISSSQADNYDIYVGGFLTGGIGYSVGYGYSWDSNNFSMNNSINVSSGSSGYIIYNARQNNVVKRRLRINITVN